MEKSFSNFCLLKYKESIKSFYLTPHLLKSNAYIGRKQSFSKKVIRNKFFVKFQNFGKKNLAVFPPKIRNCSDKLSLEAYFLEIS